MLPDYLNNEENFTNQKTFGQELDLILTREGYNLFQPLLNFMYNFKQEILDKKRYFIDETFVAFGREFNKKIKSESELLLFDMVKDCKDKINKARKLRKW